MSFRIESFDVHLKEKKLVKKILLTLYIILNRLSNYFELAF